MQLDMGSHVKSNDGKDVGKVKRIIFNGDNMLVRQFVVDEGWFFAEERMVDIDHIDNIDDDHTVHLKITEDQLNELTPYVHADVRPVRMGSAVNTAGVRDVVYHPGTVPWDMLVLSHGTEVYDKDEKHIGHLDEIVYEEDGHASCFIVDSGRIFTHDVKVPVAAVHSITGKRMALTITSDEAEAASR